MSFNKLQFEEIISKRTCYGLIWSGTYEISKLGSVEVSTEKVPCVIKMIMLTTGIHYDKSKKLYRDGHQHALKMTTEEPIPYPFTFNSVAPFYHTEFYHRRSMTPDDFQKEVDSLITLNKLDLAPQVYSYTVFDKLYEIHYGFIIMERLDGSVKDILKQRQLLPQESQLIETSINKMHKDHGIVHGDMKPSNIGIYLNAKGQIDKCLFIDCQKVRFRRRMKGSEFRKQVRSDLSIYQKHIVLNRGETQNTLKTQKN